MKAGLVLVLLLLVGCPRLHVRRAAGAESEQNATAPAFSLIGHTGKRITLDALRSDGPVMVVFYRGFW